jgi:hypothetical protein
VTTGFPQGACVYTSSESSLSRAVSRTTSMPSFAVLTQPGTHAHDNFAPGLSYNSASHSIRTAHSQTTCSNFHIPSLRHIIRHRRHRTFIIARTITTNFTTLGIVLFIPRPHSIQRYLGQLVRHLAALEHQLFVPDPVPAVVRQDPDPEGVVDCTGEETVRR